MKEEQSLHMHEGQDLQDMIPVYNRDNDIMNDDDNNNNDDM